VFHVEHILVTITENPIHIEVISEKKILCNMYENLLQSCKQ